MAGSREDSSPSSWGSVSRVSFNLTVPVLELVEGPTLADRIAKGPIPVDEALPIAEARRCRSWPLERFSKSSSTR